MNIKFGKKDGFHLAGMFIVIKCAVAFFFLFFLHGTSIGNGQQGISYNVLQLMAGGNKRLVCSRLTLGAVRYQYF